MSAGGFVFAALFAGPALTSALYYMVSARYLHRWLATRPVSEEGAGPLPPVTFFKPLKSGVPVLAQKLEAHVGAMRAGDQLLVGVEPGSAEADVADELRCAFPTCDIAVINCARDQAVNPKISKLLQMEALARHEHWVICDSEAVVGAEFLDGFRREWTRCDVLTAGYRFVGARSWPQRLDAVATLLTLWPGLAVLQATGPLKLTLGACTALRREDLRAIGGWAKFSDVLAEDHRLGVALSASGRTIRLSRRIVTLESDPLTWGDYWRHQRRIALTYRVANPGGFAGAWFTQGVTTSFLLVCAQPREVWGWVLFAAVWAVRVATARASARDLQFALSAAWSTVFFASLVETACWALSWVTRHVWWSGARWRLARSGQMERIASR